MTQAESNNPEWIGELQNLGQYLERIEGSANRLEGELAELLNSREKMSVLMFARRAFEVVVQDPCISKLHRPRGTEPPHSILDKFAATAKKGDLPAVPQEILASMRNLKEVGNLAAHPHDFDAQHVRDALGHLARVLDWHLPQVRPRDLASAQTPKLGPNPYLGPRSLPGTGYRSLLPRLARNNVGPISAAV